MSATDAEPKRDEKGNILNALSAEYLNSLGVDIAIVDSCYADGVCKDLNSRYIIASSRSDQVSFGATDIDSTTPGYQEGSLFSAMLFDDQRQLGDTPTGFITLLDETIINGIDGWLTHVYSPVKGGGNIQTPVVRNNKISGSSLIRFKYE